MQFKSSFIACNYLDSAFAATLNDTMTNTAATSRIKNKDLVTTIHSGNRIEINTQTVDKQIHEIVYKLKCKWTQSSGISGFYTHTDTDLAVKLQIICSTKIQKNCRKR